MYRVVQRKPISNRERSLHLLIAILIAFVIMSLYFLILGKNPIFIYTSMIKGSVGNKFRILSVLKLFIPLFIGGLAISFAFKLRFWNIGGEGQIIFGAIFASFFAIKLNHLPGIVLLPLMLLAGIIGGGLYASLATFIKVKLKTEETIVTLMLNYIAINFLTYLQFVKWTDPSSLGFPKVAKFSKNAILPELFGLHTGWIIAVIIGGICYYILSKSRLGYEIEVTGESPKTAKYGGINQTKLTFITVFISGALFGIVGMIQASGVMKTISTQITGGVGYTAIIIAWLAGLKPKNVLFVAFAFALMTQGGKYLTSVEPGINDSVIVMQAVVLLSVLASEFFSKFKFEKAQEGI